MLTEEELWRTDDLGMATYLVGKDKILKAMVWEAPGRCYFVFERTVELLHHVVDYTGNDTVVAPKEFIEQYNTLKKEMYEGRPQEYDPRTRTRRRRSA